MVTISEQLACAKREVGMRKRVYGRWVEAGRMTQAKADAETAAMEAIVATREQLERAERLI